MSDFDTQSGLVERLGRRERRRVWSMGFVCVVAWMGVVMLPWALLLPMVARVTAGDIGGAEVGAVIREAVKRTFLCSVLSMGFAAVCTVFFVSVSRRATLRQVNSQLREISAQLKALGAK